jgi:hypothetical protein
VLTKVNGGNYEKAGVYIGRDNDSSADIEYYSGGVCADNDKAQQEHGRKII